MSYSDEDLNQAVEAGILSRKNADEFRHFITTRRGENISSEEHFRLLTGFNDIFVCIALLLVLWGAWYLGNMAFEAGALLCAGMAWGLAEYFTRIRRMALPSLMLLIAFVTAVFFASSFPEHYDWSIVPPIIASIAAGFHWWRFKVPITIALGMGCLVLLILGIVHHAGVDINSGVISWILLLLGLITLVKAIWWDSINPVRNTRHADVAFWLHMLAAPLIVHPLFIELGSTNTTTSIVIVLLVYAGLSLISVILDRRALMVAALGYALYATANVFINAGNNGLAYALAAVIIGGGLLMLSVLWASIRQRVIRHLPERILQNLPPG